MSLRKYVEGIPERAAQRASLWHLAALPIKWAFAALFTFILYTTVDIVVTKFTNPDSFYCRQSFEILYVSVFISFICAFLMSLVAANICLWLIPPARRALEAKSSFRKAMTPLVKIILWVFPICVMLLICLASVNVCYSEKAITSRLFIFATPQIYDLQRVELVRPRCYYYQNKRDAFWKIEVFIRVKGGSELELNHYSNFRDEGPFNRIMASLRHAPVDYSGVSPDCPQKLLDKLILRN